MFVCKLRKKLGKACGINYIETVWGRGYALRKPDQQSLAGQKRAAKLLRRAALALAGLLPNQPNDRSASTAHSACPSLEEMR